jgi:hypothetical protein
MNNLHNKSVKKPIWTCAIIVSVLLLLFLSEQMPGLCLGATASTGDPSVSRTEDNASAKTPASIVMLGHGSDSAFVIEKTSRTLFHFREEPEGTRLVKSYPLNITSIEKVKEGIYFRKDESLSGLFSGRGLLLEAAEVRPVGDDTSVQIILQCVDNGQKTQMTGMRKDAAALVFNESLENIADMLYPPLTPFIVQERAAYLSDDAQRKELNDINGFLDKWKQSWQDHNLDGYIQYYSDHFGHGEMNLKEWKSHKKKIFSSSQKSNVSLITIHILQSDPFVLLTLIQTYQSDAYSDVGIKSLLIRKEGTEWKILREVWKKYEGKI